MKKSSRLKELYQGLLYALYHNGHDRMRHICLAQANQARRWFKQLEETFHQQNLEKILKLGLVQPEFMFNNANSFVRCHRQMCRLFEFHYG